jgi:hypothetical protein
MEESQKIVYESAKRALEEIGTSHALKAIQQNPFNPQQAD